MKRPLLLSCALAVASLSATVALAGCYDPPAAYAPAPPPPPPPYRSQVPPLVQLAERNGFRAGSDDGARDAYYHARYGPQNTRNYADAPGYDYHLGPIPPYVEAFRRAYLRGYERAFSNTVSPSR